METFELLPLEKGQIQDFLVSRAATLPDDALINGAIFQEVAVHFLEDTWTRSSSMHETEAFKLILANPMDLSSVAILLSQGGVPDVFALEKQQFDAVALTLQKDGVEFRTVAFSKAVFKQRLDDQEDLNLLPFKPEVTELVRAKLAQVRTFVDPAGVIKGQEIRFRHDRIRDFFTHFALLEATGDEQVAYAKDARFAGVFPYLARSMPPDDAKKLRENLITLAAQIEDHRVSDSFIREYSWRQRFASKDPEWMLEYDLPSARTAEAKYDELAQAELHSQRQMQHLRDEIYQARSRTKILTSTTPSDLVELAAQLLIQMGATPSTSVVQTGRLLHGPDGDEFLVVALAQSELIRPFHVDLLDARLRNIPVPLVVVVNWQVALPPAERTPLPSDLFDTFSRSDLAVISSAELYKQFQAFLTAGHASVWHELGKRNQTGTGKDVGREAA